MISPIPSPISQAAGDLEAEAINLEQIAQAGEYVFSELVIATLRDIALRMREFCAVRSTAPTTGSAPDGYALVRIEPTQLVLDTIRMSKRIPYADTEIWKELIEHAAAPTQGADERPVAIYQVNKGSIRDGDLWQDTEQKSAEYLAAKNYQTRIVYLKEPS